jgi:hypothetical protein
LSIARPPFLLFSFPFLTSSFKFIFFTTILFTSCFCLFFTFYSFSPFLHPYFLLSFLLSVPLLPSSLH